MSLKVQELTKIYGEQKAVDHISFEAGKGEILGFLGPNGAGKSTTMKIATCYIPPTSGVVTVAGFDVVESPLDVRKMSGTCLSTILFTSICMCTNTLNSLALCIL